MRMGTYLYMNGEGKNNMLKFQVTKFETKYHGEMQVKPSSVATHPCMWVFTNKSYSNTPDENAPFFHLTLEDAKKLRDSLTEEITKIEEAWGDDW